MHQISLAQNDTAASSGPLPSPPTASREPRWIRLGRGTFPSTSYAAASAAYRAIVERLGLGVSEAPLCEVLDAAGQLVARVAYNGRVFAVGLDKENTAMRVKTLALIAKVPGVQFKIDGLPYGAVRHQLRSGLLSQSPQ